MKIYALAVAILLQVAGWLTVGLGCLIAYRQMSAASGWIASYSGLGAFRPFVPAGIAAVGLILLALGVLVHLVSRKQ